jgi:hypothetical protein
MNNESDISGRPNGESFLEQLVTTLLDRLVQEKPDGWLRSSKSPLDQMEHFLRTRNFKARLAEANLHSAADEPQPQITTPGKIWNKQLMQRKAMFLAQQNISDNLSFFASVGGEASDEALQDHRRKCLDRWSARTTNADEPPRSDLHGLPDKLEQLRNESAATRKRLRKDFLKDISENDGEISEVLTGDLLEWLKDGSTYANKVRMIESAMKSTVKAQADHLEKKVAAMLDAYPVIKNDEALDGNEEDQATLEDFLDFLDETLEADMLMFNNALHLLADPELLKDAVAPSISSEAELAKTMARFVALDSGNSFDSAASADLAKSYEHLAECLLSEARERRTFDKATNDAATVESLFQTIGKWLSGARDPVSPSLEETFQDSEEEHPTRESEGLYVVDEYPQTEQDEYREAILQQRRAAYETKDARAIQKNNSGLRQDLVDKRLTGQDIIGILEACNAFIRDDSPEALTHAHRETDELMMFAKAWLEKTSDVAPYTGAPDPVSPSLFETPPSSPNWSPMSPPFEETFQDSKEEPPTPEPLSSAESETFYDAYDNLQTEWEQYSDQTLKQTILKERLSAYGKDDAAAVRRSNKTLQDSIGNGLTQQDVMDILAKCHESIRINSPEAVTRVHQEAEKLFRKGEFGDLRQPYAKRGLTLERQTSSVPTGPAPTQPTGTVREGGGGEERDSRTYQMSTRTGPTAPSEEYRLKFAQAACARFPQFPWRPRVSGFSKLEVTPIESAQASNEQSPKPELIRGVWGGESFRGRALREQGGIVYFEQVAANDRLPLSDDVKIVRAIKAKHLKAPTDIGCTYEIKVPELTVARKRKLPSAAHQDGTRQGGIAEGVMKTLSRREKYDLQQSLTEAAPEAPGKEKQKNYVRMQLIEDKEDVKALENGKPFFIDENQTAYYVTGHYERQRKAGKEPKTGCQIAVVSLESRGGEHLINGVAYGRDPRANQSKQTQAQEVTPKAPSRGKR